MDRPPPSDRQQTVTAEALGEGSADPVRSLVEAHRTVALRHLREGSAAKAFAELVRATRAVPMSARLAAYLVSFGIKASAEPAAVTLLLAALEETEAEVRTPVRRQLARIFRRLREGEREREMLVLLLAESPRDLRARRVLEALLAADGRWDELDASLERSARDELRRGKPARAAKAMLDRARIDERRGEGARAALRYGQAAGYLDQAKEMRAAYEVRLLWLRALRESRAPDRAVAEAVDALLESAARAGMVPRAEEAVSPKRTGVGRRETQRELLRAPIEAEEEVRLPQAQAHDEAAAREVPDPAALRQIEAALVARRAWPELAAFYRERVEQAAAADSMAQRVEGVEHLTRLAELLENELGDPAGAAEAWERIVALTGDADALREQVRLLAAEAGPSAVRKALNVAVAGAPDAGARAQALVARAESDLHRGREQTALADFDAALAIDSRSLPALAGRAELAWARGEPGPVRDLVDGLRRAPRRFAGRAELLRRAARLIEKGTGSTASTSADVRWLWGEVRQEQPGNEEAEERYLALCREAGDDVGLEEALATLIAREPRGSKARRARLEQVALLERSGRDEAALEALVEATRAEPGHQEAWLLLAERHQAGGDFTGAVDALEQAATATADDEARAGIWDRAGRLARELLGDAARAGVYERRADRIRKGLAEYSAPGVKQDVPHSDDRAMTALELPAVIVQEIDQAIELESEAPPPPSAIPEDVPLELPFVLDSRDAGEDPIVEEITSADLLPIALELPRAATPVVTQSIVEALPSVSWTVPWLQTGEHPAQASARRPGPVPEAASLIETREHVVEELPPEPAAPTAPRVEARVVESWEAPPGVKDEGPPTLELPVPIGDMPVVPTASLPTPLLKSLRDRRAELLTLLREDPLGPEAYRRLGDYYEDVGDAARCGLMRELHAALEGDPDSAPLAPKLILSATDRAALRHPVLRGPEGELLALGGIALCRAHPAKGRDAGAREEFRLEGGRGAAAAADALMAAVRILGLPAPDPFLSEDNGPPFSLVFAATAPKLLVGRLAVRTPLPEAELRFFAGRALFTQSPDLLALRTVRREELERALPTLLRIVRGGPSHSPEAHAMREGLSARALPRLQTLFAEVGSQLPVSRLAEAARHSANRAGLVVAGGVAPALAAMRAKRALKSEVVELLRFAASERYLELRTRRLG